MDAIREVVSLQRRMKYPNRRTFRQQQDPVAPASLSDTLKILEPTAKKLSSVDSQRVMSVLVSCIQKIELITIFSYITDKLGRFKVSLGVDLVHKLLRHRALMKSFEELKVVTTDLLEEESANSTSTISDSTESEETQQPLSDPEGGISTYSFSSDIWAVESIPSLTRAQVAVQNLQILADEIQISGRNILRAFYRNPTSRNVVDVVVKEVTKRSRPVNKLLTNLRKLRDLMMSRLLMTSIEEAEKNKYISQVFERERRNTLQIEKLQKSLKAAHGEMQAYINKKNDIIHKIQDDLDHVENQADEHYRRTRTEAEKQIVADLQINEARVTRLKNEKNTLDKRHKDMVSEHRESELDLRKRKYKTETELENWIHKYDFDMDSRQTKCEEIQLVYAEEKIQLNELEAVYRVMETEYTAIVEERTRKHEAETKARLEFAERSNAARILQRFWIRYRPPPKKKKKKGGKNKKK